MYKNKIRLLQFYVNNSTFSCALSSSQLITKQSQLTKFIKQQRNPAKNKRTVKFLRKYLCEDQINSEVVEATAKKVATMTQEEVKQIIKEGYKPPSYREVIAEAALDEAASRLQLSEADRLKYLSAWKKEQPQNTDDNYSKKIAKSEKDYLSKASYERRFKLDPTGQSYLEAYPSLRRAIPKPKHLTILNPDLATRTATHLYSNFSTGTTEKRLFIELNPGVGRVSRSLLDQFALHSDTSKKLALFSDKQEFKSEIQKLATSYSTAQLEALTDFSNLYTKSLNNQQKNDHLKEFLQRNSEFTKKLPPVIYGIVPWTKDFLTTFYSMYTFDSYFFDHFAIERGEKKEPLLPEFLLYLPDWSLAKLNPDNEPRFYPFNNRISIMNNLFCESKIVDEESLESFYPYPQFKKELKRKRISLNRMFLVKFKFKEVPPVEDKILFYFFLRQIFMKPANVLRQSMRSITFDVESVFREAGRLGASMTGGYGVITDYRPDQFLFLYKALINRPDLVVGGKSLKELLSNVMDESGPREERVTLSDLKFANKEMSGRLVVPEDVKKFMKLAEAKKNLKRS